MNIKFCFLKSNSLIFQATFFTHTLFNLRFFFSATSWPLPDIAYINFCEPKRNGPVGRLCVNYNRIFHLHENFIFHFCKVTSQQLLGSRRLLRQFSPNSMQRLNLLFYLKICFIKAVFVSRTWLLLCTKKIGCST